MIILLIISLLYEVRGARLGLHTFTASLTLTGVQQTVTAGCNLKLSIYLSTRFSPYF